jgi:hypothetical protein
MDLQVEVWGVWGNGSGDKSTCLAIMSSLMLPKKKKKKKKGVRN